MATESADVVVIGGGITGAAIAHQIATRSDLEVVVCEKGSGPGEGSTGASSSIVRTRYSHAEVVRLAVEATYAWSHWAECVGLGNPSAHFVRTGGVWIEDCDVASVASEVERMGAAGANVAVVADLQDIGAALSGCVEPLDVERDVSHECRMGDAFLYEPGAGYVDPMAALVDLLRAGSDLGVNIRYRCEVRQIVASGGEVRGVRLADGSDLRCSFVVNAAGPWAGAVDAMAGVSHGWPLVPTRIQTVYVEAGLECEGLPIVFDAPTGMYLRPNGSTLMMGGIRSEDEQERIEDPDDFVRFPESPFRDRMMAGLGHRLPQLSAAGRSSGIAGLYTINTTDVHPIVGPSSLGGYWVAAGFSGHGFKLAPMIGAMAGRAITGVSGPFDPTVPEDLFALNRQTFDPNAHSVLA